MTETQPVSLQLDFERKELHLERAYVIVQAIFSAVLTFAVLSLFAAILRAVL